MIGMGMRDWMQHPAARLKQVLVLAAVVLACAGGCSGVASAQDTELGSRIVEKREVRTAYSNQNSVLGAHAFATCMVHRRPSQATDYLQEVDPKRVRVISASFSREIGCLSLADGGDFETGAVLNAAEPLFRSLIAEQLLKQRYAAPMVAAAFEPIVRQYASAWTPVDGRDGVIDDMAVCAASTDPAGVRALLASGPASAEEATAMSALSPSLGRCLAANATLRGNRQSIRAALAEAMFHRVTGPVAVAAVEKK